MNSVILQAKSGVLSSVTTGRIALTVRLRLQKDLFSTFCVSPFYRHEFITDRISRPGREIGPVCLSVSVFGQ